MDGITISIIALSVWMSVSLLWTEKSYGIFEILLWFSYFVLFMAARKLPLELVMWIVLINPTIFAGLQLYYQTDPKRTRTHCLMFPILGNSNHNSALMLFGFWASMWLGVNRDPWLFLVSLLLLIAIVRTKCRGSVICVGVFCFPCACVNTV